MTVVEAVSGDAGDAEHEEEDTGADVDGDDCIAVAALSFIQFNRAFTAN